MASQSESPEAAANRQRVAMLQSFHITDTGNAEAFALLHGGRFRYDHSRGKWLVWNGMYWVTGETGEAERAAVLTARERLLAAMLITQKEEHPAGPL